MTKAVLPSFSSDATGVIFSPWGRQWGCGLWLPTQGRSVSGLRCALLSLCLNFSDRELIPDGGSCSALSFGVWWMNGLWWHPLLPLSATMRHHHSLGAVRLSSLTLFLQVGCSSPEMPFTQVLGGIRVPSGLSLTVAPAEMCSALALPLCRVAVWVPTPPVENTWCVSLYPYVRHSVVMRTLVYPLFPPCDRAEWSERVSCLSTLLRWIFDTISCYRGGISLYYNIILYWNFKLECPLLCRNFPTPLNKFSQSSWNHKTLRKWHNITRITPPNRFFCFVLFCFCLPWHLHPVPDQEFETQMNCSW